MNINSTEIKTAKQPSLSCQSNSFTISTGAADEIVNEISNPLGPGGTGDSPVAAGNLPGAVPGPQEIPPPASPSHDPSSDEPEIAPPNSESDGPSAAAAPLDPCLGRPGKRRRVGKVAQLPPEDIEWINQQLLDEELLGDILETLALRGHGHITQQNLTNWKSGGYVEWLADQQARRERHARLDAVCSLVSQARGRLDEAALMLASSQLLDIISACDVGLLKNQFSDDAQGYLKLIQAITRLNKARQGSSKNRNTSLVHKPSHPDDPDFVLPDAERGLSEETLKKITDAIRLF
jgi:hypothetical protein